MKRLLVFTIAVLWIGLGVNYYVGQNTGNEDKIAEAFSQTSFHDEESTIRVNGQYNGAYVSRRRAEELLKEIAEKLGLDSRYTITEHREENKGEITLNKKAKKAETTIKFITYEDPAGEHAISVEQFIFVELKLYGAANCAMDYRTTIENILEQYNVAKQVTVSLKGTYEGQLSLDERNIIADKLLDTLHARISTERRSKDMYVIYAYSSFIDEYKIVGNEKINVSLAMSYDEEKDVTSLYVSTPLINEDY